MISQRVRAVRRIVCGILATVLVLLATGCDDGLKTLSTLDPHSLDSAQLEASQPVEYSLSNSPATEYVSCNDDEVELSTEEEVDASTVGEQTLPVTLSKGFASRTDDVTLTVVDTRPPVVELSLDSLELEVGEELTLPDDLATVEDPVDGVLAQVEEPPVAQGSRPGEERFYDEGWYVVSDDVDTSVAGTYDVEVLASDCHGNEAQGHLSVTVIDPLEGVTVDPVPEAEAVEYSRHPIDVTTLVTCSDDEATVTAEPFAPAEVGEVLAPISLSKHKSTHELNVPLTVVDTQPPRIKLAHKSVTVELGESFNPADNVASVTDPVDGELSRRRKALTTEATDVGHERFYDEGWYRIRGTVDVNKPGTYELRVRAYDQFGNLASKRMTVKVVDPLEGLELAAKTTVLEYSNKKVDPTKLVSSSIAGASVSAKKLGLTRVGERTVTYTVTKGNSKHTKKVTFEVKDTKSPEISLDGTEFSIEHGGSFDPYDHVEYVRDPVDGDLARVAEEREEPGDGWYTVSGSYDAYDPGRYTYTVIACDCNGNRTTKEMSVTVEQAPEPEVPTSDYVINTNTGKFHKPWCRDVGRMSESNKWYVTMTRDEVIDMGYSPCQHCWP